MTRRFPLLLIVLLLVSCASKPVRPTPTPKVRLTNAEIEANLPLFGDKIGRFYLSGQKNRFRLDTDKAIYLGWLDDPEHMVILDPETESYIEFSRERGERLKKQDKETWGRYLDIKRSAPFGWCRGRVDLVLSTPCEIARQTIGHQTCEHEGDDVQTWLHTSTINSVSPLYGRKTVWRKVEHKYDNKRKLILRQERTSTFVVIKDIEDTEIPDSVFQIPQQYMEKLSDQELQLYPRDRLGRPDMLDGQEEFTEKSVELYNPWPWRVVRERWTAPRDGPEGKVPIITIRSATAARPQELGEGPPGYLSDHFTTKKWDSTPQVGDASLRDDNEYFYYMVFAKHGMLFKVGARLEMMTEEEFFLFCEQLAERAQTRHG